MKLRFFKDVLGNNATAIRPVSPPSLSQRSHLSTNGKEMIIFGGEEDPSSGVKTKRFIFPGGEGPEEVLNHHHHHLHQHPAF